jgi:hypothetical protein
VNALAQVVEFKCPLCDCPISLPLAGAKESVRASPFEAPESAAGFDLAGVKTSHAPDGSLTYPIMLQHRDARVSLPFPWQAPLPEVFMVGISPNVRGYRLHSTSDSWVMYSENQQALHELHERIRLAWERE